MIRMTSASRHAPNAGHVREIGTELAAVTDGNPIMSGAGRGAADAAPRRSRSSSAIERFVRSVRNGSK